MRTLAVRADVLTPNLTELFPLLGDPFRPECTDDELKAAITELANSGPDIVIITGVPVQGKPNLTSVIARSRTDGRPWKVTCPYLPAHYPGTGDAFTSVITGSLLQGDSLPIALDRAAQFILQGIRATFGYQTDNREGILLEHVLQNLSLPIQSATYELVWGRRFKRKEKPHAAPARRSGSCMRPETQTSMKCNQAARRFLAIVTQMAAPVASTRSSKSKHGLCRFFAP